MSRQESNTQHYDCEPNIIPLTTKPRTFTTLGTKHLIHNLNSQLVIHFENRLSFTCFSLWTAAIHGHRRTYIFSFFSESKLRWRKQIDIDIACIRTYIYAHKRMHRHTHFEASFTYYLSNPQTRFWSVRVFSRKHLPIVTLAYSTTQWN